LKAWVTLSAEQISQLFRHYSMLIEWNKKISLTSVKPGPEMVIRHYCESLFFGAHLPGHSSALRIYDIGSGAGFPGFPMAVLRPEWHVVLVESVQRKAVFLRESTRQLENVAVLAQRAKDLSESADWIVSRAVDPEEVLWNVPRLAAKIGMMLGEDDFSVIKGLTQIAWADPIRLPWGDRRLCVYGESVPRET
jgi:16S rRNA (guanine(527)-N(7))-methyltransferase RsmG